MLSYRLRSYMAGRDPLAVAVVASIVLLVAVRSLWLAGASVVSSMHVAQPTPALPIIMIATPVPAALPTIQAAPAVDPALLAELELLRARVAALEAQPEAMPVVYVPQVAEVAPAAAPTMPPPELHTASTVADPLPPVAPAPPPVQAEQPQSPGGSGKMPAIDFQAQPQPEPQMADADTAARWCAAAASAGQVRCK